MNSNQTEFLRTVGETIKNIAFSKGYNFPSAIIAQAILETGWGQTKLSKYHNYFGMKCGSKWKGKSVNLKTWEEYNGKAVNIYDNFRAYATMTDGIYGYFEFINSTRYKNLKTAVSSSDYIQKIKADGWATDSKYVTKLLNIVKQYNLNVYDKKTEVLPIEQIALQVIAGAWGNGEERKQRLAAAGYDYKTVQSKVNEMLRNK